MAKRQYKRKRYFILMRFQLKYIAYILFFLYVGAAVAGYTVYYTSWVTLGEKLANVYPMGRLVQVFKSANVILFLRLLMITPIFILVGTILSHRIAGPVYRIGKYIDDLIGGDFSQDLKLRKKDELKELERKMTELAKKLREDKKTREEVLDSALKEVTSALESSDTNKKTIKEIIEKLEKLK